MTELHAISRERHGDRRWSRFTNYAFAAKDVAGPLVIHELPRAALSMPTAFIRQDDSFALVAVQGLGAGKNLFVAPDGRWLGAYIPAAYRGYPFKLARTEDGRRALCVDEGSGLVTQELETGEPFFSADGKLAKPVAEVMDFLSKLQGARLGTAKVCSALEAHDLLHPWSIQLKLADGKAHDVQGLFSVNEAALNALPADALLALRDAGALSIAYAQLLSMQHLPMLGRLIEMHAKGLAEPLSVTPAGDLDLEFLNRGDTLSFGNLH